MQRLQAAGHAVKTATEHLVAAARQSINEDERALIISDRMVILFFYVLETEYFSLGERDCAGDGRPRGGHSKGTRIGNGTRQTCPAQ